MEPESHPAYLPPEGRDLPEELARQASVWVDNPVLHEVLESVDGFVLLVNAHHQILLANVPFLRATGAPKGMDFQGWRLGEVLGCIHVPEGADGCGTSPACAQCGIARALSDIRQGSPRAQHECLLSRRRESRWEAMELRVRSSAFPGPGDPQILLVCQDISAEKRREALESVFFHDVLNTLGGLRGWVNALREGVGDPVRSMGKVDTLSARVIEEVRSHRLLTQAERGDLTVARETVAVRDLVTEWAALAEGHPSADGRRLVYLEGRGAPELRTDAVLARRVLLNMTLNALEATPSGGTVTCAWREEAGGVAFQVHNAAPMPPAVAQRVFQRSYSTKAARGRGLGTYSMKLFGETYLGGAVGFTTTEGEGTTFRFWLPREA